MQKCINIYNHPVFQQRLKAIEAAEADRKFCLHNLSHALDTARIGYIIILENKLNIDKELFYSAALLHDIGRCSGIPHNEAGAALAREIMPQCGFTESETELVSNAILVHRSNDKTGIFSSVLYTADKKSRVCFRCPAADECYWENEKRNNEIDI